MKSDDLDIFVDIVERNQERQRREQVIKTQDEKLKAQYVVVEKQKAERAKAASKQAEKRIRRRIFAIALSLGLVGGMLVQPYVDGYLTMSKNDGTIGQAFEIDYNNAMYVEKMETYKRGVEIQYLPVEDRGFFYDGPTERTPDVSDAGTMTYVRNCVDIIDSTCRDLTNGEKGYIEMLVENAEIKKDIFKMDVDSIGEILGVDLEEIYSPEELARLANPGVNLGGK